MPPSPRLCAVLAFALLAARAAALDPDALSARYRGWHYFPDWIIPPICLNPQTCPTNTSQTTTDVFQLWQLPDDAEGPTAWRAVYLQYDGTGYETYMATTHDMLHFSLSNPTLVDGQPGCIFSPRAGRPPTWDTKPAPGSFDYGGITFIGPLLQNYTVGARATLRRNAAGLYYYAYGAYPSFGYESAPGADGMVRDKQQPLTSFWQLLTLTSAARSARPAGIQRRWPALGPRHPRRPRRHGGGARRGALGAGAGLRPFPHPASGRSPHRLL